MATSASDAITVRRAGSDELHTVVAVAGAALGWSDDRPNDALFAWKHRDNPFGASPMWVAVDEDDGGRAVGFRTFLRWRFALPDGTVADAVRAVDTATLPSHQGRGIFTRLTLHAVEELTAEGVGFVFNTPNERSRPGYLKMGWRELGRLPIAVRPTSLAGALRTLRARVPAERWSERVGVGDPAPAVLTDDDLGDLLAAAQPGGRVTTARSPAFLRWRYGFAPLDYRAIALDDDPARGLVVFRHRRRGDTLETTVCDVLVRDGDTAGRRRLVAALRRATPGDYLIRAGSAGGGFLPLPRQGPVVTWRDLTVSEPPPFPAWALTLGDIELF